MNLTALIIKKKALRDKQSNLTLEEKVAMLDRLHEHALFIKKNPIKRINK